MIRVGKPGPKIKAPRPIRAYQLPKFADTSIEPHPFFLGALFELLPPATAFQAFQIELLEADNFYQKTYIKAGRSLLRFSSAEKAAEFVQALQKDTGRDLKKFLRLLQRDDRFRNYIYRRYQMDEMLRLLRDPDSMTDKDLYLGLYQYLSNFTAYLPGGYGAGKFKEVVEASASLKRIFRAALLRAESKEEEQEGYKLPRDKESFVKRVEFLKLALDIFNVLAERYKFDPQELWK